MNPKEETAKRLSIANKIGASLKGVVEGIMLGGSMGFGQNFSVRESSDIDTVVILEREILGNLLQTQYFEGKVNASVAEMFKDGKINFFWVTRVIDEVEVNLFVYEKDAYTGFCMVQNDIIGFNAKKPRDTQTSYGFDGKAVTFDRHVTKVSEGFTYSRPALAGGKYWGGVPRQDFFFSGYILYEKDGFLTRLGNEVWKATVKQLVKECGQNPDLSKFSILKSHYTYQTAPERLPQEVISQIAERTKKEIKELQKH